MTKLTLIGRWLLLVLVLLSGLAVALFVPWNLSGLDTRLTPARDYADAQQRIAVLQSGEGALNPLCRTQFMTHGQKVARTILFVHGFTTCPEQFGELGRRFYALGYNVLIVPVPHHGLRDRMTDEQSRLTAEELTVYTDRIADVAQGLGEQVVMAGISLGGVTTAWAAQNRSDVDLAVLIAPAFGFKQIPAALTVPTSNLLQILPDTFQWWNPALGENGGPPYAYPRYSTRSLGQIMRLGQAVRARAERTVPAAGALLVVTNASDPAVNNEVTAQVVRQWREHGARISTYEFDARLGLAHDIIDPNDQGGNIGLVYPQLIQLINQ